ncbi:hypothetical protein TELCIR_25321, partial [Teladorsagia circumcincta]
GIGAADRSVESAIGNGELDKDSMNRALCILIAKVDRFYSKVGHELNLRSLCELCVAVTNASENRIFYSEKKAPSLTPATNLLSRVASSAEESRVGITALSEAVSSLILTESQGLCFNQMLVAPFQ